MAPRKKTRKPQIKIKAAAHASSRKTKSPLARAETKDNAASRRKRPEADAVVAPDTENLENEEVETRAAGQAGNLQGLPDTADADSESVDELLEEGNSFEAGIIKGVEDAADADRGEVRTHEVLEDDVPEEYLDDEDE